MSNPNPPANQDRAAGTADLQRDPLPAPGSAQALPPATRQRLAHLFRHAGENTDVRYLHDLVLRYRGLPPP